MKIDSKSALTLSAFIRSALSTIERIENHVSQSGQNVFRYSDVTACCVTGTTALNPGGSAWLPSLFRHAYELKVDEAKTVALWNRWSVESALVKQSLTFFANGLETLGKEQ